MKRLFVFDMDGTLLPKTTAMLQIAEETGHTQELRILEEKLHRQEIVDAQFAKGIFDLWEHLNEETVKNSFERSPKIQFIEETLRQILSFEGISCLITSAPAFFAEHFYGYGFDYIFASKPFVLGKREFLPEHIICAHDKPILAKRLCQQLGLTFEDTIAFGDSRSDLSLFQSLSNTVSVNGDHHIKNFAKYHYNGTNLLEALNLILKIKIPSYA